MSRTKFSKNEANVTNFTVLSKQEINLLQQKCVCFENTLQGPTRVAKDEVRYTRQEWARRDWVADKWIQSGKRNSKSGLWVVCLCTVFSENTTEDEIINILKLQLSFPKLRRAAVLIARYLGLNVSGSFHMNVWTSQSGSWVNAVCIGFLQ